MGAAPTRAATSTMSRSPTSYRLRLSFVAGALAPLVVSLWDAVIGLSLPGSSVSGIGEQGPYFFAILGPAVITGLLLAAALLLLYGAASRRSRRT